MGAGQVYRWLWWTIILQLPALLGVVVTAGLHLAHPGSWLGIVGLLSTVTVMQVCAAYDPDCPLRILPVALSTRALLSRDLPSRSTFVSCASQRVCIIIS